MPNAAGRARARRSQAVRTSLRAALSEIGRVSPVVRVFVGALFFGWAAHKIGALAVGLSPGQFMSDKVYDAFSEAWTRRAQAQERAGDLRAVLVDFDQSTFEAWDRPVVLRREKVAAALSHIRAAGPGALFIDMLLDYPGAEVGNAGGDSAFIREITRWRAADIPVVLVRTLRLRRGPDGTSCLRPVRTFLDGDPLASAVTWSTTEVLVDEDGRARRMQSGLSLCPGSTPSRHPSAAKVVARAALQYDEGVDPSTAVEEAHGVRFRFVAFDTDTSLAGGSGWYSNDQGRPTRTFERVALASVVEDSASSLRERFRDRVVFIGASHEEAPDRFDTPLGTMPGSILLYNMANAAYAGLEIHHAPLALEWAFLLGVIGLAAWLVSTGRHRAATLCAMGGTLAGLGLTATLFLVGIWFEPLPGIFGLPIHLALDTLLVKHGSHAITS